MTSGKPVISRFALRSAAILMIATLIVGFDNMQRADWSASSSQRLAIWRNYGRDVIPRSTTVCPAGVPCLMFNNQAPITPRLSPIYVTLDRPRTVRIEPAAARIDYLDPAPQPLKPGWYESDHPSIRYSGSWIWQSREGPSRGEIHTALELGSLVAFDVEASAVEIGMAFYDDRRAVEVCVDDRCRNVELFSHRLEWQQPILAAYGLSPGVHKVEMRLNAGKAIDLDWVRVAAQPPVLTRGTYTPQDSPAAFLRTTGWDADQGSLQLTASVAFSFEGQGVRLDFPVDADTGEVGLCLDDICRTEDLFSFHSTRRNVELKAISPGLHHVVITKGRSRRIDVPKVTVF